MSNDVNKKSLWRSLAVGDFYGKEIEIRAGLGQIGSIEKKRVWADYKQLLMVFFSCFQGQKKVLKFLKNIRTKKLLKLKLKKNVFIFLND